MFGRISARIPKFIKKRGQNSYVCKIRSMFIKRGPEFHDWKEKIKITPFQRTRLEFQDLEG